MIYILLKQEHAHDTMYVLELLNIRISKDSKKVIAVYFSCPGPVWCLRA